MNSRITVNSVSAIRHLVRENAGVHWGPYWMFHDLLDKKAVVQILPTFPLKKFPIHAVFQSRAYVPRKVRAFIGLLRTAVAGNEHAVFT